MTREITIVDRGRGPQLSTSRVTVMDLIPYFQEGCSVDEIIRWIPTLTPEEIAVAEGYYRKRKSELDDDDQCVRERNARRSNPPWVEELRQEARAKRLALLARHKANGEAS